MSIERRPSFEGRSADVRDLANLSLPEMQKSLPFITKSVHELYTKVQRRKQGLGADYAVALSTLKGKLTLVAPDDYSLMHEVVELQKKCRKRIGDGIMLSDLQGLSCEAFWKTIALLLNTYPSLQTVELEGGGSFKREDLLPLLELGFRILPQDLQLYLKKLDEFGFPLRTYSSKNYSPLLLHVIGGREEDVVKDLQTVSKDVLDVRGRSPLLWACLLNNTRLVDLLLEAGANPGHADIYGTTPLISAAVTGNRKIAELLFNKGADIEVQDNDGWSPLMWAVDRGDVEIAKLYLQKGADVNSQNKEGKTPLMWACITNQLELAKLLLSKGADVNLQDNTGYTTLMMAALHGNIEIVKLLLDHRADVHRVSHDGFTVLTTIEGNRPKAWKLLKNLIKVHAMPDAINFAKYSMKTKLLAHTFQLKGKSPVRELEIEWEGFQPQITAHTIATSIPAFAKRFPSFLDRSTAKTLSESLQFAADQEIHTAQEYLDRIKGGLPTFILIGPKEHSINLLLWNDMYVYCDRRYPSNVYRFDPDTLDTSTIQTLLDSKYKTEEEFKRDIQSVESNLKCSKGENETEIARAIQLPRQVVANCAWAAIEGNIKAYLLLAQLKDTGFQFPKTGSAKFKEFIDSSFTCWLCLQQVVLLQKYVSGEHDPNLAHVCFRNLWLAQAAHPEYFDKESTAFLEEAPKHDKKLKEIHESLQFRIQKLYAAHSRLVGLTAVTSIYLLALLFYKS